MRKLFTVLCALLCLEIQLSPAQNIILLHKALSIYGQSGFGISGYDILSAGVHNNYIYAIIGDTAITSRPTDFHYIRKYDLSGREIAKLRLFPEAGTYDDATRFHNSIRFTDSGRVIYFGVLHAIQYSAFVFDNNLTNNPQIINYGTDGPFMQLYMLPNNEMLTVHNKGSDSSIIQRLNSSNNVVYSSSMKLMIQFSTNIYKAGNAYYFISSSGSHTFNIIKTDLSSYTHIDTVTISTIDADYSEFYMKPTENGWYIYYSPYALGNDSFSYSLAHIDSLNHLVSLRHYREKGVALGEDYYFHEDYVLPDGAKLAVQRKYIYGLGYSSLMLYGINSTNSLLDKPYLLNQVSYNPIPDNAYFYYGNKYQKIITYSICRYTADEKGNYYAFGALTLSDSGAYVFCMPIPKSIVEVYGRTIKDRNNNCTNNSSDTSFRNLTVEATSGNGQFKYFTQSDDSGKYSFFVDTGKTTLKVYPPNNYWGVCQNNIVLNIPDTSSQVHTDFLLYKNVVCPKLTVSVSTGRLRPCTNSDYIVSYCNKGTADAVNASVVVEMDSMLIVNGASIPYTSAGNIYTFQLQGIIKEDSCSQFIIHTTLNCVATLGATHCVTAHIYPDSLCGNIDSRWDRANVTVDGRCLGDSVLFRIRNIGIGNMSQPKRYIVIEDNVLRIQPSTFQLNAGQELLIKRHANGTTQRLMAEQVDYFPYPSHPTAVVEGCGGLTPGFVNNYPNDDGADFIAISCVQNVNSLDPNDKSAVPAGVNNTHLIPKNVNIEYKIRFQNTGTDTAYDVIVLDTISSKLNIATLQMGAASHPYTYEISGNGQAMLKVVFRNINLVDSFHNEALSHGFFTYTIAQDTANTEDDLILNKADIYFDYNTAVETNTTSHTVAKDYIQVDLVSEVKNVKFNVKNVKIFPNPFRDKTQIIVESDPLKDPVLLLMNLEGSILKTIPSSATNSFDVYREDLATGMYIFKIIQAKETIATGKLVVQ